MQVSKMLTSLITLPHIAGTSLYGRAFTAMVETITRATSLLNAIATGDRACSPFRPWRPNVLRVVTGCKEKHFHI